MTIESALCRWSAVPRACCNGVATAFSSVEITSLNTAAVSMLGTATG